MREYRLTLPELGLIAGTRGMLGFGIGMLLSSRLKRDQRAPLGMAMFIAGALTSIPLGIMLFRGHQRGDARSRHERPGDVRTSAELMEH